jgi:hypothetical protein
MARECTRGHTSFCYQKADDVGHRLAGLVYVESFAHAKPIARTELIARIGPHLHCQPNARTRCVSRGRPIAHAVSVAHARPAAHEGTESSRNPSSYSGHRRGPFNRRGDAHLRFALQKLDAGL